LVYDNMALEADYLIVGAGAMGMAFADVLVHESNATAIIIDKRSLPGGHWNTAYPFVTLHQPSAFYGVNSMTLGQNRIDSDGWNQGLYELATNSEVCHYFQRVMVEKLLPSGQIQFIPNAELTGNGSVVSTVTGQVIELDTKKIVDATYMKVQVPSMRPPEFPVADGVSCIPVNTLPEMAGPNRSYVIIGAGKTGMDACLWLLARGVDPKHIRWIMPRDSWLLNREFIQPFKLSERTATGFAHQMQAFAHAPNVTELFGILENAGQLLRIDPARTPSMYRCATVTRLEIEQLRRIKQIIRKGRVTAVMPGQISLEQGRVDIGEESILIDCTADGLANRPAKPIFNGQQITLQSVRTCQQVFSAAFIAHIEVTRADESTKNEICTPVPHPDTEIDYLRTSLGNARNGALWASDTEISSWLAACRLDGFSEAGIEPPAPTDEQQALGRKGLQNLQRFVSESETS
jgi:hypothetical protein